MSASNTSGIQTRQVQLSDASWDAVNAASWARAGGYTLRYTDPDGDEVTVGSAMEWDECLRLHKTVGGPLKLRAFRTFQTGLESAPPQLLHVAEHSGKVLALPEGASVVRAFYGDPNALWSTENGIDVTERVRTLQREGGPITASNALFTDPCRGVRKTLAVEFASPLPQCTEDTLDILLEVTDTASPTRAAQAPQLATANCPTVDAARRAAAIAAEYAQPYAEAATQAASGAVEYAQPYAERAGVAAMTAATCAREQVVSARGMVQPVVDATVRAASDATTAAHQAASGLVAEDGLLGVDARRRASDSVRSAAHATHRDVERAWCQGCEALEGATAAAQQHLRQQGLSAMEKGNYAYAVQWFRAEATLAYKDPTTHYNTACALALNGEGDAAISALRLAAQKGYSNASHMAADADLESLRSRPEWAEVLATVTSSAQQDRSSMQGAAPFSTTAVVPPSESVPTVPPAEAPTVQGVPAGTVGHAVGQLQNILGALAAAAAAVPVAMQSLSAQTAQSAEAEAQALEALKEMGFSEVAARAALQRNGGDPQRAALALLGQ